MRSALVRPLAAAAGAAALLATAPAPPARAQVALPTDFVNDVIVGGLDQPTSFAFLPDGRFFVTEQKTGKVRLIVNGHVAATDPALVVPNLASVGDERGLLGIAVDPAWPTRPFVYLYYDYVGDVIRLVRYTATGDLAVPTGENITLNSPRVLIGDVLDETIFHQAGCLRFGPDGMLYASLGDDAFDCKAFDITSLHGVIVRLKVDGVPAGAGSQVPRSMIAPPDNPFIANSDSNAKLVWAWGLRNPWRYQIDHVTGLIYGCDVGDNDFEEEDEIRPGDFLGWPYREANMIRTLVDCPEPGGPGATPYVPPIANFARDTNSHAIVSGGMYRPVSGAIHNWPTGYYPIRGDVFYTDYFVGDLKRITWNGSSWSPAAPVPGQPDPSSWGAGFLTASDFQVGLDGSLWWMQQFDDTFNPGTGSVNRIRFNGTTGVEPGALAERTLVASPNPFVRAVDLSFRLAAPERVRLAIFDLSGREVATLLDGAATAGENHARWDGLDARGGRVRAGVYFARLDRGGVGPPVTLRLFHPR